MRVVENDLLQKGVQIDEYDEVRQDGLGTLLPLEGGIVVKARRKDRPYLKLQQSLEVLRGKDALLDQIGAQTFRALRL
jgi:hypothetical protein